MMSLNKWQREILKLEETADKSMNRKLYNAYNETLKDVRKQLKSYMDEYEDLPYYKQQQTGKLAALEKEIAELLNGAYPKAKHEITEFKQNELMDGYYTSMYQIEGQTGARLDFLGLDTEFVRQSVTKPIAGVTLSKRLYKSRTKLANRATSELRMGMVQGKTYAQIAGAIKRHTEANYAQAVRIARTEGGRLRSVSKQVAYNEAHEMGIDLQKQWYSSLDNRTRSSHQLLDGQTKAIDEDFVSPESGASGPMPRQLGRASEDINCRCTTITIVDGIAPESRYAKGNDEHSYDKTEYKSYKDWKDKRTVVEDDIIKPKPLTPQERMTWLQREIEKLENEEWGDLNEDEANDLFEEYEAELISLQSKKEFDESQGDIEDFFTKQENHKKWKASLTDVDMKLIEDYTGPDYNDFNKVLRESPEAYINQPILRHTPLEYKQNQVKRAYELEKALDGYVVEQDFVTYRGVGGWFDTAEWDKMVVGEYSDVFDKGYMSTTLQKDVVTSFTGKNSIVYEIHVKEGDQIGAYVGEMSRHKVEKEFLIKPNTKFKVIGKDSFTSDEGYIKQSIILEVDMNE